MLSRPSRASRALLGAGLVLALVSPAGAEAGNVRTSSSQGPPRVEFFSSDNNEVNRVTMSFEPGAEQPFRVIDTAAPIQAGEGCTAVSSHEATCNGDASILPTAFLGGADDSFTWGSAAIASPPSAGPGAPGQVLSVGGGDGNDTITGSSGTDNLSGGGSGGFGTGPVGDSDTISGGGGDDLINDTERSPEEGLAHISGGEGNDIMTATSSGGTKVLEGGDGNDDIRLLPLQSGSGPSGPVLQAMPGSYLVDSGPGNDRAFGVTLDRTSGAIDENAGGVDETFRGGAGDDTLSARGGADSLEGGEGNDLLEGGDDNDVVIGEAGDDEVLGGVGDDRVEGGDGNDDLLGGRGIDSFSGGADADLLKAFQPPFVPGAGAVPFPGYSGSGTNEVEVEPEPDSLSCGSEADAVIADPTDQILADCEQLGSEAACPLDNVGACEATITLDTALPPEGGGSARVAGPVGAKRLELGQAKLKIPKATAEQIAAGLSKKGKRLVARRGKLRVRITLELISKKNMKTKRFVRKTKVTLRKA